MDNKLSKLKKLNKTLNPSRELSGVFLPTGSQKQLDFMFVAEMPSMNMPRDWDGKRNYNFDVTKRDKFFQKMMRDNRVAGSYATGIVKEINIPRRPTPAEIKEWRPYLLKEIKIIQPKAIVVVGKTTYDKSFKPFVKPKISKEIKVDWVFHYRQQGRKTDAEVEQRFSEVISRMRNGE